MYRSYGTSADICRYCSVHFLNKDALCEHISTTDSCRMYYLLRRLITNPETPPPRAPSDVFPHPLPPRVDPPPLPLEPLPPPRMDYKTSHPDGEDEEAMDGADTCVVCMVNKPLILGKCGHLRCCIGCSKTIYHGDARCPNCREPWVDLRRVYRE